VVVPGQASAATQTCVSGTLEYDHHDAEAGTSKPLVTSVARNADWVLSDASSMQVLASGITDADNGTFDACFAGAASRSLSLTFSSSSTYAWKVIADPAKPTQVYSFTTQLTNVSGKRVLGVVKPPIGIADAWNIVDSLLDLWGIRANPSTTCWTRNEQSGSCTPMTFVWPSGDADTAYWDDESTHFVYLGRDSADSRHTVLHESGHAFEWLLHDKRFPAVTDCDPHYIERSSSASCAWTEGFADAVAAHALGDYRYVFSDGTSADFTNNRSTPGWDSGDTVQGRVSTSLLDLWSGPDGGTWNGTIDALTRTVPPDFRSYFRIARPAVGLSTTGQAKSILYNHTISY
jgi:hypothetical protein